MPERIRLLESSRDKSQNRIREIEELLERERAITQQRQSLSEGVAEEVRAFSEKVEKAEKLIAERDKKITDLEKNLDRQSAELSTNEKAHIESLEREEKLTTEISRLIQDNALIERKLELMIEERENLQKQLLQVEQKDSSYALVFSQDERLGLLKTIDTLIERVDFISGHNADVPK
jgi:chromosome segregation ATPase